VRSETFFMSASTPLCKCAVTASASSNCFCNPVRMDSE
jgi:hypothetical protein